VLIGRKWQLRATSAIGELRTDVVTQSTIYRYSVNGMILVIEMIPELMDEMDRKSNRSRIHISAMIEWCNSIKSMDGPIYHAIEGVYTDKVV
jgi:hypothetical protein